MSAPSAIVFIECVSEKIPRKIATFGEKYYAWGISLNYTTILSVVFLIKSSLKCHDHDDPLRLVF